MDRTAPVMINSDIFMRANLLASKTPRAYVPLKFRGALLPERNGKAAPLSHPLVEADSTFSVDIVGRSFVEKNDVCVGFLIAPLILIKVG